MRNPLAKTLLALTLAFCLCSPLLAAGDEAVFSGPQPGEKITGFTALGVYDKAAGKKIDFIKQGHGKPLLLVFVHKLSRPGHALTTAVTNCFHNLKRDDLQILVVHLAADHLAQRDYLTRARQSLKYQAPVAVSLDGEEGPGAYGLNRNVSYTFIIAKDDKVTANFALVQPSLTEAAKIAKPMAEALGIKPPTQEQLQALGGRYLPQSRSRMQPQRNANPNMQRGRGDARPSARPAPDAPQRGTQPQRQADPLRDAVRALVSNSASPEEVETAAKKVEQMIKDKKGMQNQLGTMSGMILERGMGTPAAQRHIKKWNEKYGKTDQ
ncbi:MAG: hypothetical protein ACYTGQ_13565 [Planctomycetota bacterium]|jgi:hypothetical protein